MKNEFGYKLSLARTRGNVMQSFSLQHITVIAHHHGGHHRRDGSALAMVVFTMRE